MPGSREGYDALLAQIRDNYIRELPDRFNEMESLVLELLQGGDRETFETLFRVTHSIKGSAGTYGLDIFTTICHNLEDNFYEYQENIDGYSKERQQGWLSYVDLLRRAYTLLEQQLSDFNIIEKELDMLRNQGRQYHRRGLIITEHGLDIAVIQQAFAEQLVDFSVVQDGMEGLERLLMERFDVYITNNQLPRLNGVSIIAAIKQSPGMNRDTPAVLISSQQHLLSGRTSDPEYVVLKDSHFSQSLGEAVGEISGHWSI